MRITTQRGLRHFAVLTSLFTLIGCTGVLGRDSHDDAGGGGPNGSGANGPNGGGSGLWPNDNPEVPGPPPGVFSPAPLSVPRLTTAQYSRSLLSMFGADAPIPTDLERDVVVSGYTTAGAYRATFSTTEVESLETAARNIAAFALAEGGPVRARMSCGAPEPDEACARSTLRDVGRLVFRKDLAAGEENAYVTAFSDIVADGATAWEALVAAVSGLLQSPKFLFRIEVGQPVAGRDDVVRYTSSDMASRIAFATLGHGPDEQLLSDGAAGKFDDPEEVAKTATKLLAGAEGQSAVQEFFSEYLELDRLEVLSKDASNFPLFGEDLSPLFAEETRRLIEANVLVPGADARNLFTTPSTFLNERLASVYGVPGVVGSEFREVLLGPETGRRGYLGQGSFLATHAHVNMSSPTLRGKFIRERLLCETIPAPPANIPPLPETTDEPMTTRERLRLHREEAACANCHALMDPIGVAFENFDAIGAFRTVESGLPVDSNGDLDGAAFADAPGLVEALGDDARLGPCIARQITRYIVGREELSTEEVIVSALADEFVERSANVTQLVPIILSSDLGRFAGTP